VPGFKPEDIEVTIEDRVLSIVGKSGAKQFTRTLVLHDEIDAENVGATVEHGMLTLALHVHPKAQPRKIAVNSATVNSAN
jgi:HSP20 family protein